MRRSAGFEIADHIVTYYVGNERIDSVIERFSDYIKQETLSREINKIGSPDILTTKMGDGIYSERFKIADLEIVLAIKKQLA